MLCHGVSAGGTNYISQPVSLPGSFIEVIIFFVFGVPATVFTLVLVFVVVIVLVFVFTGCVMAFKPFVSVQALYIIASVMPALELLFLLGAVVFNVNLAIIFRKVNVLMVGVVAVII